MNSRYVLCCVIGMLLLAVPCTSRAQGRRYGRSGVVQGPDGPLYDTRSPEWRMSGGNLFVYEQIMEEKMMLQQQKLMMRQQQQMLRQTRQAARKKAQRAAEPAAIRQNGAGANDTQSGTLPARRRKKSLTTPRANAPAASSQKKSGATSTPASAPSSKPSTTSSAPLEPSDSP